MPANWGQGRIEVLALCEEIQALRIKGRSIRSIYVQMRGEGRVSVSYNSFYKNVRKLAEARNRSLATQESQHPTSSIVPKPVMRDAPVAGPDGPRPRAPFRVNPHKPAKDLIG